MDQRTANAALVTVLSAAVTELIRAQPDGIAVFSEVRRRVLQDASQDQLPALELALNLLEDDVRR